MKIQVAMGVLLGMLLVIVAVAQFLIHELHHHLASPAWTRQRIAWTVFALFPLARLAGLFLGEHIDWYDLCYVGILLIATVGSIDSYRLLLTDLAKILTLRKERIDKHEAIQSLKD